MASLACGRRLSLRNQYDTKTPRASVFLWRSSNGRRCFQGVRRPSREKPGNERVAKKSTAWVSKCPSKTFFERKDSKNSLRAPEAPPNLCCVNAAKSFLNVSLGRGGRKPS